MSKDSNLQTSNNLSTLKWRHNGRDSISNHQPCDCLLSRLIRLRVTGLCVGNSPETGEFPAQRASNAENVSIWWRHHDRRKIVEGRNKMAYFDKKNNPHILKVAQAESAAKEY